MPPITPTAVELRESAAGKLTKRELDALRAELRRELRAELAAAKPAKAPRVRELPELASCARRMVAAVGRRAAQLDPEDLAELVQLRADVDAAVDVAVAGLRSGEYPRSWAAIGGALGMSRQAAQQRWGK